MRQTITGDDRLFQQLRTPSPGTFAGKQEDSVARTPGIGSGERGCREAECSQGGGSTMAFAYFVCFVFKKRAMALSNWHFKKNTLAAVQKK